MEETIADLCERLRETDDKYDCEKLVEMWGLKCNDFKSCGECGHAFYGGLADRIEAAHEREMARRCGKSPDGIAPRYNMQTYDVLGNERSNAIGNLEKMDLDTGGAIKKLAVALGVEWNAANADKSVTLLKERIIHLLGGHLDERKEPTRETYTGLTVNMGKPCGDGDAVLDASTIRAEDTREKLEEDIKSTQWCVSLKDVLGWLDRQAAITEREVTNDMQRAGRMAVEVEREICDELRVKADRQKDALERCRLAYETVRGLFDGWEE